MPYISAGDRGYFDEFLDGITPKSEGELNYCITKLVLAYLATTSKRYDDYNAVIGVLECAKLECYRRAIAPYEDKKIQANGDVY